MIYHFAKTPLVGIGVLETCSCVSRQYIQYITMH
jgi:hypothetical protein